MDFKMWLFYIILLFIFMTILFMIRNNRLLKYQLNLIEKISKLSQADIHNGKDWRWRYGVLDSINYNIMLYKFWRSFDSFYPDKKFLEP